MILCGAGGLWWTSVLNSGLPPQRLRSDTQLEHQDPVSHIAQKKSEKKRKNKKKIKRKKVIKIKNIKNKKIKVIKIGKKERREQPN